MLKIEHGYKNYGEKSVLIDINLEFKDGKSYGIVGRNGSGKTQILKSLAGFIKLSRGRVLQDNTIIRQKNNYIEDAGIVIEIPEFISGFTLEKNLKLIKDMCKNKNEIDLEKWIKFYNLEEFRAKKFKHLSLGTRKKMCLIQAFMHNPKYLLLDEPMDSLDEESVRKTRDYLLSIKKDRTLILTSHNIDDIDILSDSIYKIVDGKLV